jgi:hypothetical protein
MFSSKNFIQNVHQVPSTWIFETYLGLAEPLSGQRVRMNSMFNPADKTPSMFLYYDRTNDVYKYKCFSTGRGGSAIELMMQIWNCNFRQAAIRITDDYTEFLKSGKRCDTKIVEHSTWVVTDYTIRKWSRTDASFWLSYNITSANLEEHNVRPIDRYTMTKKSLDGAPEQEFIVSSKNLYGYFTKEGVLYKIYQPFNNDRKFIKICDYVQGMDQLKGHKHLIITSSLKDLMACKSLPYLQVDLIAPDSENTILDKSLIEELKDKYEGIVTMMDSDQPGINSMQKYKELYNLPFVYLPQEKDLSDIVKMHGAQKTLQYLAPVLHRSLDKYKEHEQLDITTVW